MATSKSLTSPWTAQLIIIVSFNFVLTFAMFKLLVDAIFCITYKEVYPRFALAIMLMIPYNFFFLIFLQRPEGGYFM